MWQIIIGIFIALNVVSTIIILAACVVSGRQSREANELVDAKLSEQIELATAIAKLRQVDSGAVAAQA